MTHSSERAAQLRTTYDAFNARDIERVLEQLSEDVDWPNAWEAGASPALAAAHRQRPAAGIEVALAERERLLDAQPAAPEHDDQRAQPEAMSVVGGLRMTAMISSTVGGIKLSLVAGRTSGVVAGHGRRRAPPTGGIEHW